MIYLIIITHYFIFCTYYRYINTDFQSAILTQIILPSYINTDFQDVDEDLSVFWKSKAPNFPKMSILAKKILSLPPSSAENERSFSRHYHLTETRESLSDKTIDALFTGYSFYHNSISL